MKSEKIVREWYDIVGKKCLRFYKESQKNEINVLSRLMKIIPSGSRILNAS